MPHQPASSALSHIRVLDLSRVRSGPIYQVDEMFSDPQVQHIGMAQSLETDPFGATQAVGQPVELTRTPSSLVGKPPARGEHTSEVLAELGLSADQIADCAAQNII